MEQGAVGCTRKNSVAVMSCAERYEKIEEQADLKLNKGKGSLGARTTQCTLEVVKIKGLTKLLSCKRNNKSKLLQM